MADEAYKGNHHLDLCSDPAAPPRSDQADRSEAHQARTSQACGSEKGNPKVAMEKPCKPQI